MLDKDRVERRRRRRELVSMGAPGTRERKGTIKKHKQIRFKCRFIRSLLQAQSTLSYFVQRSSCSRFNNSCHRIYSIDVLMRRALLHGGEAKISSSETLPRVGGISSPEHRLRKMLSRLTPSTHHINSISSMMYTLRLTMYMSVAFIVRQKEVIQAFTQNSSLRRPLSHLSTKTTASALPFLLYTFPPRPNGTI